MPDHDDNQPRKKPKQQHEVTGYRALSTSEVLSFDEINTAGAGLSDLIADIQERHPDHDPRWLSVARTHLQQGLMALRRAVHKPDMF